MHRNLEGRAVADEDFRLPVAGKRQYALPLARSAYVGYSLDRVVKKKPERFVCICNDCFMYLSIVALSTLETIRVMTVRAETPHVKGGVLAHPIRK